MDGTEPVWTPYVVWGGVVQKSADTVLDTKHAKKGRPKQTDKKLQKAIQFLEEVLKDGGKPATWLFEQALGKCDSSKNTLRSAADALGIKDKFRGEAPDWIWTLPPVNVVAESSEAPVTVDEGMFSR